MDPPAAPVPPRQQPSRSTVVKPTDREADRGLQPIAIDPPRRHIVSPILGGIGGAAALAATLFEVSAYMKYATLRDTCAPPNGLGCTEDEISLVSSRANTGARARAGSGGDSISSRSTSRKNWQT